MKYKLGELTKIRTGKLDANASSENGKYPFFTCSKETLRISTYSYDCECVLVAGNGDLNIKYYNGKFEAYQRTYIIEDNGSQKLYIPYLYFFMERYVDELRNQSIGGVVKYIKLSNLTDALIELPNFEIQKQVVKILRKVSEIIKLKHTQINKLDKLIKARFVEMFGDPIRNTQCRPTTKFINVVKMQRGFDLPVQDRQQDGAVSVYGSNGVLGYHNNAKIKGGGIITGRSGTIGKVFYTEDDYWPLNTSLFSVDTYGNNVIYLAYLLQMYDLTRFVEGTGVPTLNRNMFHNKPIIDVSKEEQNIFAAFVHQTDKSKFLFWIYLLSIKLVADFQYKAYNILIDTCEITALCLQRRSLYGRTGFNSI